MSSLGLVELLVLAIILGILVAVPVGTILVLYLMRRNRASRSCEGPPPPPGDVTGPRTIDVVVGRKLLVVLTIVYVLLMTVVVAGAYAASRPEPAPRSGGCLRPGETATIPRNGKFVPLGSNCCGFLVLHAPYAFRTSCSS